MRGTSDGKAGIEGFFCENVVTLNASGIVFGLDKGITEDLVQKVIGQDSGE